MRCRTSFGPVRAGQGQSKMGATRSTRHARRSGSGRRCPCLDRLKGPSDRAPIVPGPVKRKVERRFRRGSSDAVRRTRWRRQLRPRAACRCCRAAWRPSRRAAAAHRRGRCRGLRAPLDVCRPPRHSGPSTLVPRRFRAWRRRARSSARAVTNRRIGVRHNDGADIAPVEHRAAGPVGEIDLPLAQRGAHRRVDRHAAGEAAAC